jgi:hypothetical protein
MNTPIRYDLSLVLPINTVVHTDAIIPPIVDPIACAAAAIPIRNGTDELVCKIWCTFVVQLYICV